MGRALLSLIAGLIIAVLAIWIRDETGASPPLIYRAGLLAMSALLLWAAGANYLLVRRRKSVLASGQREWADISISKEEDSESSTYFARVDVHGEVWRVPLAGRKPVRLRVGFNGKGWAWRSVETGAPLALEVEGVLLETYPMATRLTDERSKP